MKINFELAEEIGWHIGDGSMNFYKGKGLYQLRGHIEDDELHYINRIKPLFEKIYKVKVNLRKMPSTRVFGFQIWDTNLVKAKQDMGLPLGRKDNVEIPKIFLKDKKIKISVIRGIFDTDGGIYLEKKNRKMYSRLYVTTISKRLSEQLLKIFTEFGLRATVYSQLYDKFFKRKRSYIITIRGVEMFHNFMKIIQPQNPKHCKKYSFFLQSQNL